MTSAKELLKLCETPQFDFLSYQQNARKEIGKLKDALHNVEKKIQDDLKKIPMKMLSETIHHIGAAFNALSNAETMHASDVGTVATRCLEDAIDAIEGVYYN
jgi:hypothetical protein